jgi:hypothetical protein
MDFRSSLQISDDRKVEIVLKLLESSRSQIMTWHNQAYVATTASLGLVFLVTKVWMSASPETLAGLLACEVAITAFAVLTQFYLRSARDNYNGNEENKLKCEYALRLKDENAYFDGARFYWAESGEKDRGMPFRDMPVLRWAHAIASFLSGVICLIAFLSPKM